MSLPKPAAVFPMSHERAKPRGLIERALAEVKSAEARKRCLMAASRYIALQERAAGSGVSAMNWAGEIIDGGRSFVSMAPRGALNVQARDDVLRIHAFVGAPSANILTYALIGEMSAAALSRQLGVRPIRAVEELAAAMECLADALDMTRPS